MHLHPLAVAPADIDHMGHVNNAVYLSWVQEAVVAYWEKVAPAEAVGRHLWVALKHEITFAAPPFWTTRSSRPWLPSASRVRVPSSPR